MFNEKKKTDPYNIIWNNINRAKYKTIVHYKTEIIRR